MAHTPAAHAGVALARLHVVPQVPHDETVVLRFVSQPSAGLELQSAYPALHMPTEHVPAVQAATALARLHT